MTAEKNKGLLTFLLDILDPERHFKLLEDTPKRFAKKPIDNIRYQGLQFKTHQRKTLWIEPDTFLMGQARVLRNKAARDKEIALLSKQLYELAESEVKSGERLSWQIDELSSFDQKAQVFIYNLERQRIN